jgi:hypothetical protein
MAYEIISNALRSKRTGLSILAKYNFATCVGAENSNSERIEAVVLDDFLMGKAVAFLKMDIEGAELEALRGAQKHIAN